MIRNQEKIVAFIPVRGGSKSIPLKNIKEIGGKPLVIWSVEAALLCDYVDEVYVCTDSLDIQNCIERHQKNLAQNQKLRIISRPAETATDTASTESAMLYFCEKYKHVFEHIVLIQATSPLLSENDLTQAIEQYSLSSDDSLLSVVEQKRFIWDKETEGGSYLSRNYDYQNRPRRQDFKGYFVENGAFYITSRRALQLSKCRLSGKIGIYQMPEESYFEIDEPSDWIIIEKLLEKKMRNNHTVGKIKMLLTDCDGVLTDAGMYYSEKGDELKKFNTKDGMGIQILKERGIKFGIITGESSELVIRRAEKLKADECHVGVKNKLVILEEIMKKHGLSYEEIAYIGDDINDIDVLTKVGFSCCPRDAIDSVKNIVDYVCDGDGGTGVVREVIEFMLEKMHC